MTRTELVLTTTSRIKLALEFFSFADIDKGDEEKVGVNDDDDRLTRFRRAFRRCCCFLSQSGINTNHDTRK